MARPSPKHAGNPALASIGKAVRTIRKDLRISQEELAHAADLDRSYVGGIERGEHNLTVRIPADRDQSFRIIVTTDSGIVTGISGLS
ncbi:helix-turn-helix domain-containing protein [Cupriavidus sp. IDO]|uniref:helix-turn-helix domain-containing protein n=1 Tax=Cupriavidus sp. IDO TaxID=1539142 RepID=UPI000578F3C1|nr:helix-turn-helix transcriptional regulator [Cupriavidus sp. IDO]KWR88570.1 hypothetical protein RM96_18900 [Cupriavidus sp. IDO]